MTKFTFYWRTGDREVFEGTTPEQALTLAGYGGGAARALDFWSKGENDDYTWNATTREWDVKPDSPFGKELAAMKQRIQATQ